MTTLIEKLAESKDLITYREIESGLTICLKREDLIAALRRFKLFRRVASHSDFYTNLFHLINLADRPNLLKFITGFPAESIIYILWRQSKLQDSKFTERLEKELTGTLYIPLP